MLSHQAFANTDVLGSGLATTRPEILVQGTFQVAGTAPAPVVFTAPSGQQWYGVRVLAGGKGQDDDAPFDAIVGTSGTVGEGFDEPRLDTLVFATPVVAVTQAIGRILRRRNAHAPLVVDPVDPIAVCTGQWFKRVAAYKAAGHCVTLHARA